MSLSDKELVILLVHHSRGQTISGRTRFQKIVYLLEEQEINFGYGFRPHLYGPYSEDLKNDITMLVKLGLIEEEKRDIEFDGVVYDKYEYSLTEDGRRIAERIERKSSEIVERLRNLVNDFQDLSTGSLILSSKFIMNNKLSKEYYTPV